MRRAACKEFDAATVRLESVDAQGDGTPPIFGASRDRLRSVESEDFVTLVRTRNQVGARRPLMAEVHRATRGGQCRPDVTILLERATRLAVARMERVHRRVRSLPSLVSGEEWRRSLGRLVTWFEQVCIDARYSSAAPEEGIRAICRTTHPSAGLSSDDFAGARWAVSLAEEVVACRRLLGSGGDTDVVAYQAALSRLEVSMSGCHPASSEGFTGRPTAS